MRLFNKVAIIGVGLVGGSIALAIKKRKLAHKIVGVSRRRKTLLLARQRGAIDKGAQELSIIKDADLVIFATPVSTILNLAPRAAKFIKPDCIVSDVGSTKKKIASKLGKLFAHYVGSHPLAGSEKQGVINASPDIFKDSLCILTPINTTNPKDLQKIKRLWVKLGARVLSLAPEKHDKILSVISHLPHIIAFSLMKGIPGSYLRLASSSLRDTTRIAASDSQLWADIFLSNQKDMLSSIGLFQKNLSRIKSAINKKDKGLLLKILRDAKKKRDSLNLAR